MLVRIIRKILGKQSPNSIQDPIYFNSKENIDNKHSNFKHFIKILNLTKKSPIEFMEILEEKKLLSNNLNVIDVGCGAGNLLVEIQKKYPKAKLLGTDFSDSKVENSRKVYENIQFSVHDIYNGLKNDYDLILCTEVLEHLLYPKKALKNLISGISPKGSVFITIPNGRIDTYDGHINFWSIESWRVFLEENLPENFKSNSELFSNNTLIYSVISRN